MKRILLIIGILASLSALAGTRTKTVTSTSIITVISDCRHYEGVEVVNLGRIATAALKGAVRIAAINDPDAREALKIMNGIRGITVLDFEDCSGSDKAIISRRLERALSGSDMLMEASDSGDKMKIYGVMDEKSDKLQNFVMYSPSDCALICIFGSISMDVVAKQAFND
jgi:hypothetical protein